MAVAPDDPQGAVSLVTRADSTLVVLQAALLAAVTSAIATVMIGAKLPDVGVFAAALGFAFLSLQGDTAAYLLMTKTNGPGAERVLAGKLMLETGVWFALLLVAMIVAGAVSRWCGGALLRAAGFADHAGTSTDLDDLAISECPGLGRLVAGAAGKTETDYARWHGPRTTAVMVVAGIVLYSLLVSGSSPYTIRHGQTCFAVFTAFYLGGWIARRWYATRTSFWGLLAVPITLMLGYAWTMVAGPAGGRYAHLANIPGTDFLRALPITFVSVGAVAALMAHWSTHPHGHADSLDAVGAERKPTGRRHGA
jgi:hypothetical protein